eukprot:21088_1
MYGSRNALTMKYFISTNCLIVWIILWISVGLVLSSEEQEQQLKWVCPNTLCKHLNSNGDKCSACLIKKDAEPKAYTFFRIGEADLSSEEDSSSDSDEPAVVPEVLTRKWKCRNIACSCINKEIHDVCQACRTRKDGSTTGDDTVTINSVDGKKDFKLTNGDLKVTKS